MVGADDDRVPLLGLRIKRARPSEGYRLALRFEGTLVAAKQCVSARDGRVQLDHVSAWSLLPIANVFARELNIKIFFGKLDLERLDWRARY